MADETYEIEFIANTDQFGAGARKATEDLNKIGKAAERLNKSEMNRAAQAGRQAHEISKVVSKKFEELTITQKLVALEERRHRLHGQMSGLQAGKRRAGLERELAETVAALQMIGVGNPDSWRAARSYVTQNRPIPTAGPARVYPPLPGAGRIGGAGSGGGGGIAGGGAATVAAATIAGAVIGLVLSRIVRGIARLPGEAQEKSQHAQNEMDAMKKLLDWSEGARENLAEIANVWDTMILGLKKGVGETIGLAVSLAKIAIGAVESLVGKMMQYFPGMFRRGGAALEERGDNILAAGVGNLPKWLGGVGGTGESDAATAELRGKKAEAERQKRREQERERIKEKWETWEDRLERAVNSYNDKQRNFAFGGQVSGFFGGGDAGRAGMFAAGSGFETNLLSVQRAIYRELQANTEVTERLGDKIARDLELI